MDADPFRFDGRRALVVGGATGMGAATAELVQAVGAEVVVMDHADVEVAGVKGVHVDLADSGSIDRALDECGGPIHALFACAGVADGAPGIEKINFIGHRHLIDRAISAGLLPSGSAIAMISSAAGLGWETNLELLKEYLDTPDFDSAAAWIEAHPDKATYMWSKQAICAYVARSAMSMQRRGIRINAILPGPTDTPLARANEDLWLGTGADYREAAGLQASTAQEQAGPLVFLCSEAAAYVNGTTLITDGGWVSSGLTGSYPDASPIINYLYGR
jgi:NAD(P)-dependent dehydrogenase (short-subunit alcohol dehydrogenase family)